MVEGSVRRGRRNAAANPGRCRDGWADPSRGRQPVERLGRDRVGEPRKRLSGAGRRQIQQLRVEDPRQIVARHAGRLLGGGRDISHRRRGVRGLACANVRTGAWHDGPRRGRAPGDRGGFRRPRVTRAHPDRSSRGGCGRRPRSDPSRGGARGPGVAVAPGRGQPRPGNLRKEGAGLDLPIAASVLVATGQVPGRPSPAPCSSGTVVEGGAADARGPVGRDRRRTERLAGRRGAEGTPSKPRTSGDPRGRRVIARTGGDVPAWHLAHAEIEVDAGAGGSRRLPISPMCGKRRRAGHSRWPPPADTTCCSSARPARQDDARPSTRIDPARATRDEALEATQLHSVAGLLAGRGLLRQRLPVAAPFDQHRRLLGAARACCARGGESRPPRRALPGRTDRVRRDAIESLRQPLEDGCVVVTRASGSVTFPRDSRWWRLPTRVRAVSRRPGARVRCREDQRARYMPSSQVRCWIASICVCRCRGSRSTSSSGPRAASPQPSSGARADAATDSCRYRDTVWTCNAHLPGPLARRQASLTDEAEHLLGDAVEASALSGRGFDRVIKVGRTIADMEESPGWM